jgi:hypothetical protein
MRQRATTAEDDRNGRICAKMVRCSLLLLGLNWEGKWVWGLMEMLPPGARSMLPGAAAQRSVESRVVGWI